jgi:hypothetical protein
MSLIPNESYSFPDDEFLFRVGQSRKPEPKISIPSGTRPEANGEAKPAPPAAKVEKPRTVPEPPPAVKVEKPRVVSEPPPMKMEKPRAVAEPPMAVKVEKSRGRSGPPPAVKLGKRRIVSEPPLAVKVGKLRVVSQPPLAVKLQRTRKVPPPPPVAGREPARATSIPAPVHLKPKPPCNTHLVAQPPPPERKDRGLPRNPPNGSIQRREPQQTPGLTEHPLQIPTLRPDAARIPVAPSNTPAVPSAATAAAPRVPMAEQIEFDLTESSPACPGDVRRKFVRFVVCESTAIVFLMVFALLGLSRVFSDRTAIFYVNILTIMAAVAATLIPIFFYAIGPTLPREEG